MISTVLQIVQVVYTFHQLQKLVHGQLKLRGQDVKNKKVRTNNTQNLKWGKKIILIIDSLENQ